MKSNLNINFQSNNDDYLISKIFEHVHEFSTIYVGIEANNPLFLQLLAKHYPKYKIYEGISYYHSKTTNNLEPYKDIVIISDNADENIAVKYTVTNINEDSDTVKDFDYSKDGIFTGSDFTFFFPQSQKQTIKSIIKELKNIILEQEIKNRFHTIGADQNGFKLISEQISNINDLDIKLHYGKKFVPVLSEMVDNLKNKFFGLFLLYGSSGTGKSTLIRYLIKTLCNDKTIIYIPAYMIEQLANPEFISFLQKSKESILILEDAEFALQTRTEEFGAQAVSNLLNITNGLLNDVTRIQVIATFNMDKKNIDKALLRPGRLLGEHKFENLSIEDSIALATHLQKDINITVPMTVAEIYNGKTVSKKTKKRIGIKDDEN